MAASTHYLAVFAVYQDEKQEGKSKFVLLAFSSLLDEEDLGGKKSCGFHYNRTRIFQRNCLQC